MPIMTNYPYGPNLPREVQMPSMSGVVCDRDFKQWYARLHPFRYATLAVRGVLNGADVDFAAGTQTIFDKGAGEAGTAPMTGNLNNGDTDLSKSGAMTDTNTAFVILGVGVTPMEPWTVAAGAAANGGARTYNGVVSSDYGPRASRALAHTLSMELKAEAANACRYHLGSFGDWGSFYSGNNNAQGGSPGGAPGVFTYLATPAFSAGYKDSNQLFVETTLGETLKVLAGATPFPAGQDLISPFRVYLFGYPVCPENPIGK